MKIKKKKMGDFKTSYNISMGHEGGYANNPKDSGGETWKGVARKHNPNWYGWVIIDKLKKEKDFPQNLGKSTDLEKYVLDIYKKQYWDVNKLDQIKDQNICNELFDTGINMGVGVASKFLQKALNVIVKEVVTVDGIIGSKTLNTVNNLDARSIKLLFKVLNVLQGNYYIDLIERKPDQKIFVNSWFSRVIF